MEREQFGRDLHFWARNASNESAALQSALRLGLFERLPAEGQGPGLTRAELAERLGASFRGVRAMAELLTASGMLALDDQGRFTVRAPLAEALASRAFRARCEEAMRWWGPSGQLVEAVRTGAPVQRGGRAWDVLEHYRQLFLESGAQVGGDEQQERFFDRLARGFLRTQALITAAKLEVLERVVERPSTAAELASRTSTDARGVEVLARVLARMGLLEEEGGSFRMARLTEGLLDAKSLPYFTRSMPVTEVYWDALEQLDDTVRSERYVLDLKDPATSQRFYAGNADQITGIFASHFKLSRSAAALLQQVRPLAGARVLDIGTGSGVWGAAFAKAEPGLQVTFVDQPKVLEQARTNLEKLRLLGQCQFMPGNCMEVDYGSASYDIIILPQVCNALSPRDLPPLFERVARALRPGGFLLIAEYVLTDRRDGPLDHLYFAFRRFLTNEGDLLSLPEYTELLAPYGLGQTRCYPLLTQELVLASRGEVAFPEPPPRA